MMTDYFSFMGANGMGWMMWGMGLFWLLVIVVLLLAAAALVKYLLAGRRREERHD
jgi:tellurite resistance protein TehA-like permease